VALILDPDSAVREISSGACVGVGGTINAGHPMALVRALIRARVTGLTVVGLTNGLELDFLVAAGCATTLSAAYVGAEEIVGLPPGIRWAAEEGRLEVWESEEGIHLASLRARALKLPYTTWTGTLGTSCTNHPLVETAVDDATGASYLKVRPLKVDAGLVWAEAADEDGNLLLWGPDMGDEWLRNAADLRIAQVERIVPTSVLSRHPDRVMPWAAEIVVRAPLSTHPFGSSLLRPDDAWIIAYTKTVTEARRAKDPAQLEAFVDDWIRGVDGEDGYLGKVGITRLRALMI
jgi:glutaconate CoA-transferase, subunit A